MQEKEYESKWQYVMHTENMQAKFIQWYLTVCAAVFVFIYSDKVPESAPLINEHWFSLGVLSFYSILTCLRLLAQKRNYDTYTRRLQELEGKTLDDNSVRWKIFSVFKLQYYVICLVGGLVFMALSIELGVNSNCSILIGIAYALFGISLSFSQLIGK